MTASRPAEFVQSDRRERIVAALVETVDRVGPVAPTVNEVVEAAGLSKGAFYEHFRDLDDCFEFTCDAAFDILFGPFSEAYAVPGPWTERLNAAFTALLAALAEEPLLGEMCLVHSPARQRDRCTYGRAVDFLAEALREGRPAAISARYPSLQSEKLLASGAIGLIAARLATGRGEGLEELAPQLVWLLAPSAELGPADWHVPASQN